MYDLLLDNEIVGSGLSFGELNQWLIELDKELNEQDKKVFRRELGLQNESQYNFEEFLYNNKPMTPLKLKFKSQMILITEH